MSKRYAVPHQAGRVAIVTGATSGLGLETARRLARAGATVVLAVRSAERGAAVRDRITAEVPGARVDVEVLDLASMRSVADFVERWDRAGRSLDVLVNNAGVMALPRREVTVDGFETQMQVNYLAAFALTAGLLPALRLSSAARVVMLSSLAARVGRLDAASVRGERRYDPWLVYGTSKLADLVFARELDRRARLAGWPLTAVAAHPGITHTNLGRAGRESAGRRLPQRLIGGISAAVMGAPRLSQQADRGAEPILYAATSPHVIGGGFYGPDGFLELHGGPEPARVPARARDQAAAGRLWAISEQLTGARFPVD
jgi:NAD(P)-dependent dehydrogenase (short-subunit alcohol dehydrogenase family)